MGPVSSYGKYGGTDAHRVHTTYHSEVFAEEPRQNVGDAGGRGSSVDSRYVFSGHVHWPHIGEGIPVSGNALYF